jgi:hypothetical protein
MIAGLLYFLATFPGYAAAAERVYSPAMPDPQTAPTARPESA